MPEHSKALSASPLPEFADDSPSEHIYIGGEDLNPDPAVAARTVRERVALNNPIRRLRTDLTLYEEGFLKVERRRGGKLDDTFRLDLRYLDPYPTIERVVALRTLYVALGSGGIAALSGMLLHFAIWPLVTGSVVAASVATLLVSMLVAAYRSYERTEFVTLHGRAPVLRLFANLGSIKRFRSFGPTLSRAITQAAERSGDGTAAFLRAEMREHYRLRGDGVLSRDACAQSTRLILAQFDARP